MQMKTKKNVPYIGQCVVNIYTDDVKVISEKNTDVTILLKFSTMCSSNLKTL